MLSEPESLSALAREAPPKKAPVPVVTALRSVIAPVSSATPVPVCANRPWAPPAKAPWLVPRMKLLDRTRPPESATRAPLPDARVTSPEPKAAALLTWTVKGVAAAPPVTKVPPA